MNKIWEFILLNKRIIVEMCTGHLNPRKALFMSVSLITICCLISSIYYFKNSTVGHDEKALRQTKSMASIITVCCLMVYLIATFLNQSFYERIMTVDYWIDWLPLCSLTVGSWLIPAAISGKKEGKYFFKTFFGGLFGSMFVVTIGVFICILLIYAARMMM